MNAEVGNEVDPREIQTLDVSYINGMPRLKPLDTELSETVIRPSSGYRHVIDPMKDGRPLKFAAGLIVQVSHIVVSAPWPAHSIFIGPCPPFHRRALPLNP